MMTIATPYQLQIRFKKEIGKKNLPHSVGRFNFVRAIDGVRTRDLRLGKPPLCQLSYYRIEGA